MKSDIAQYLAVAFFFTITICFFLAWFFWQRARHRELMAMVEKGMNPTEHMAKSGKMLRTVAIVLLGVGAAAAIQAIIRALGFQAINGDAGTLAVFGLSIGAALYYATRPDQTKEK